MTNPDSSEDSLMKMTQDAHAVSNENMIVDNSSLWVSYSLHSDDLLLTEESLCLYIGRGGKSTKIFYSSKSTITLMKFYLSTSKSTSLKIYSSKSKK